MVFELLHYSGNITLVRLLAALLNVLQALLTLPIQCSDRSHSQYLPAVIVVRCRLTVFSQDHLFLTAGNRWLCKQSHIDDIIVWAMWLFTHNCHASHSNPLILANGIHSYL